MVPATACLDADNARAERREETGYLGSSKPFPQHHRSGSVDTVNLENVLCQVETNDCRHGGRSLSLKIPPILEAGSGAVHAIKLV
jgi:hypothetical protein